MQKIKALWKMTKTAAGGFFKGAAGWQVYAVAIAIVLSLIGGALYWFNSKLEAAYQAGAKVTQLDQVKSDLDALKNVVDADKESRDAVNAELEKLGAMRARIAELERLRDQDLKRFDRTVGSASESALRAYASQAERDIAVVERSRDGFAAEAVQAGTSAWGHRDTMLARREAIRSQRGQLRPNPETKE